MRRRRWRQILYRSAITGRFVTAAYARRYPAITVREARWLTRPREGAGT